MEICDCSNQKNLKKGLVFYYRSKKHTYGAVVLDYVRGYSLIAISEPIQSKPTLSDILSAPLFTISWFSDVELLRNKQVHFCSIISTGDYNGRAGGIFYNNGTIEISNYGSKSTWLHKNKNYSIKGVSIEYVCSCKNVPRTFINAIE